MEHEMEAAWVGTDITNLDLTVACLKGFCPTLSPELKTQNPLSLNPKP